MPYSGLVHPKKIHLVEQVLRAKGASPELMKEVLGDICGRGEFLVEYSRRGARMRVALIGSVSTEQIEALLEDMLGERWWENGSSEQGMIYLEFALMNFSFRIRVEYF